MFSILPLQLATNVFLAETAEDLDRFYGLDKISQTKSKNSQFAINYSLPPELSPRCASSIIELDLEHDEENGGALTLKTIPPSSQEIVIYDNSKEVKPLKPGQICIVSPNMGFPKAFYKPTDEDLATYREREIIEDNQNDLYSERQ